MAYAGNNVNIHAALQNYLSASGIVSQGYLAQGANLQQGINEGIKNTLSVYEVLKNKEIAEKELALKEKDTDSAIKLRDIQGGYITSQKQNLDKENTWIDKNNQANLDKTNAETAKTKEETKTILPESQSKISYQNSLTAANNQAININKPNETLMLEMNSYVNEPENPKDKNSPPRKRQILTTTLSPQNIPNQNNPNNPNNQQWLGINNGGNGAILPLPLLK